jgi:GWxTD domain-containing protein
LWANLLFAQKHREDNPALESGVYSEYNVFGNGQSFDFYYSYRIEYNRLVFIKDNVNYTASYRLSIEVSDSSNKFIEREFVEKSLTAKSFDETNSSKLYTQGTIHLNIDPGYKKFVVLLTDLNTNKEILLKPISFNPSMFDSLICFKPIVIESKKNSCNGDSLYVLTNYNGNIPFSNNDYYLIIPFKDTTLSQISVILKSNRQQLKYTTEEYFISSIKIEECQGTIILRESSTVKTKNFIIRDFNKKLEEGIISIQISDSSLPAKQNKFLKEVTWINEPISLRNLEFSIKMLRLFESDLKISEILNVEKDSLRINIYRFWKPFDPTPGNEYNELMAEFYYRVDYAVNNFSTLSKFDGAETDRGKTYIRFGVPDKLERSTNKENKISEIWIYTKLNKQFIFVDNSGTGNFILSD